MKSHPVPRARLSLFRFPLFLAGTFLLAGCTEDEIGSALSVELIGPGTGRVNEEVSVLFNVMGRRLDGVIFTWGDGAVDSLPTAGAQTASGSRRHTYRETGRFLVRATAEDGVEGVASAEVMINIEGVQASPRVRADPGVQANPRNP